MDDTGIAINIPLLISRWCHLAAAITAIGGSAFALWAFLPSVAEALEGDAAEKLRAAVYKRWARVVHVCIGLLLVSGFFNFYELAVAGGKAPTPYHVIFGVKLLLALVVFFIVQALVGRAAAFEGMRSRRTRWLGVVLVLAACIVVASGVLNQIRTAQAVQPTSMRVSPARGKLVTANSEHAPLFGVPLNDRARLGASFPMRECRAPVHVHGVGAWGSGQWRRLAHSSPNT